MQAHLFVWEDKFGEGLESGQAPGFELDFVFELVKVFRCCEESLSHERVSLRKSYHFLQI